MAVGGFPQHGGSGEFVCNTSVIGQVLSLKVPSNLKDEDCCLGAVTVEASESGISTHLHNRLLAVFGSLTQFRKVVFKPCQGASTEVPSDLAPLSSLPCLPTWFYP